MKEEKPLILISNDDGYHAKGLHSLVKMLADVAHIIVCAPEAGRSGFAGAFSVAEPLRLKRRKDIETAAVWSCSGTPVDCIKLAFSELLDGRKPHLVLSGINHGGNAAVNVHYSGTMGAVIEGCLKHVPAVGFSLCDESEEADFSPLRPVIRAIVRRVLTDGLPTDVCLNVNFPPTKQLKGIKVCRMNRGCWVNECEKKLHPRGFDYYWITGHFQSEEPDAADTDLWALNNGFVAVTPTRIDVTDYPSMERLQWMESSWWEASSPAGEE